MALREEHYRQTRVLDRGFIRLVDVMGDDSAICQAARVSFGQGTRPVSDDRSLIRTMMRHGHTTPFEMCEVKFHVKTPMDCWRQWIRQRTANVNEYSSRYSEVPEEFQSTPPNEWRIQSKNSKQGSDGYLSTEIGERLSDEEMSLRLKAYETYKRRLAAGVSREQARKDLLLSVYTTAYWKIDLHNLFNFLEKRMAPDAQKEIRQYANAIADIVMDWVPLAWEAFMDYRVMAVKLSLAELTALHNYNAGDSDRILSEGLSKRETDEFHEKLMRLGYRTASYMQS